MTALSGNFQTFTQGRWCAKGPPTDAILELKAGLKNSETARFEFDITM